MQINNNVIINNTGLIDYNKMVSFVNYLSKNDRDFIEMGLTGLDLTHIHAYTDNVGNLLFFKPRFKKAGKKWVKPCFDAGNYYRLGLPQNIKDNEKRPLYNLFLLENSPKDMPVYIVEGEKCADALAFLGFYATTTGGAQSKNKFDFSVLKDRQAIIWADYDTAGDSWARGIYSALIEHTHTEKIKIIDTGKIPLADGKTLGEHAKNSTDYKGYDVADLIDRLKKENSQNAEMVQIINNLAVLSDDGLRSILEPVTTMQHNNQDGLADMATVDGFFYNGAYTGFFQKYVNYRNGGEVLNGLYFLERDKNDNHQKYFICSPISVQGATRDKHGENWGRLLEFCDLDGITKRLPLPIELLQGDGQSYRKILANHGLIINPHNKARALLDIFLQFYPIEQRFTCIDETGWHGNSYALPSQIVGDKNLIFQTIIKEHGYSVKGVLTQWQSLISDPTAKHDRLCFALCVGFSGQLLKLLDVDSIGFHFVGASSMGKSLALQLTASIWGNFREFVRTWKATGNALENTATLHNDGFLALDEISEVSERQIGDIVYMLGNGQGKSRMNKDGLNKEPKKWRIAYLSTGEKTLKELLSQNSDIVKAGQEVRLIHINADAGQKIGMFNIVHDTDPATQAQNLKAKASKFYGSAGVAWLEFLVNSNKDDIKKFYSETKAKMLKKHNQLSAQKRRIFESFILVATAGELATHANITGWQQGRAVESALNCFDDWLMTYGKNDDLEETEILSRLIAFIQSNSHGGRLVRLGIDRIEDKINNLAGYLSKDDKYVYFTPSGLEQAIHPYSVKKCLSILRDKDLLKTQHGNKCKVYLGNNIRGNFYAVKTEILDVLD